MTADLTDSVWVFALCCFCFFVFEVDWLIVDSVSGECKSAIAIIIRVPLPCCLQVSFSGGDKIRNTVLIIQQFYDLGFEL